MFLHLWTLLGLCMYIVVVCSWPLGLGTYPCSSYWYYITYIIYIYMCMLPPASQYFGPAKLADVSHLPGTWGMGRGGDLGG